MSNTVERAPVRALKPYARNARTHSPRQIAQIAASIQRFGFFAQLSELEALPVSWGVALRASRGIYLLTCPRTTEQYVGAALGADGFLGRWLAYARSGHGGNVGLKIRDPSDYRVSILEVAGSSASTEDILAMEALWKAKLQSREMGLNRN